MTPIPPAKPSASSKKKKNGNMANNKPAALSCKPGINWEVNERGWSSMRKEFLNGNKTNPMNLSGTDEKLRRKDGLNGDQIFREGGKATREDLQRG